MVRTFPVPSVFVFLLVLLSVGAILVIVRLLRQQGRQRPDPDALRGPRPRSGIFAGCLLAMAVVFSVFLLFFLLAVPAYHIQSDRSASMVQVHSEAIQDFDAWREQGQMTRAPAPPESKRWVTNAAGSRPTTLTSRVGEGHETIHLSFRLPGSAGWLAGYSPRLAPSPEAAMDLARESAASLLRGVVLNDFLRQTSARPGSPASVATIRELAREAVNPGTLESKGLIVDTYTDEVRADGPATYRAAILIQAGPETRRELTGALERLVKERAAAEPPRPSNPPEEPPPRDWASLAMSVVGLAVVIFLLYSFLNAGNMGRFAWPLRIVSILTLGAIYVAIAYLRGWLDALR